MRLLLKLMLFLCAGGVFAAALPRVEDVQEAVRQNDYGKAEKLTRDVLAAKPDNAKAHYILAEILAHEGHIGEARTETAAAVRLDPAVHFTSPERLHQFQTELDQAPGNRPTAAPRSASSSRPATAPVPTASSSVISGSTALILFIVLLVILIAGLVFSRRATYFSAGGTGYGYGGGSGGSVAAGLGGLAAGMLLERALDGSNRADVPAPANAPDAESVRDRPIDFGNDTNWGGGDSGGSGVDTGSSDSWD